MSTDLESEDEGETWSLAEVLAKAECSLAATIRQYRRAVEANDADAVLLEKEELGCWLRRIMTIRLEIRIDMSSSDWVWLDANESCEVALAGTELNASGRVWCSLPEGRREWTEPFAASVLLRGDGRAIETYTLRLGTRATLLNLDAVARLVRGSDESSAQNRVERIHRKNVLSPAAPTTDADWAYVFRRGDDD